MADIRGSLPLSYVHKKYWAAWVQFLDANKDRYWPKYADGKTGAPPLALLAPNSRPMPDPMHACSLDMAKIVAAGRMKPYELKLLHWTEHHASDEDNSEDSTDPEDETNSSIDSNDSDLPNFDSFEQEMADLLKSLSRFELDYEEYT